MAKLRHTFIKIKQKGILIIIYFILVLSSVITCSYAFMLPVATPPNAIVYAASTMSTKDMQHKSQLNTQQQYRHDGNTGNTTDCIVKMNEAGCIGENLISN